MSDRDTFRFGPPPVTPVLRGLALATLIASGLAWGLPVEARAWLLDPNPVLPWTLVIATLVQVHPALLSVTLGVLWVAGPFFDGCLSPRAILALYLGCGAAGHLVSSAVLSAGQGSWVPASGRGAAFALCALGVGYAHYNGRQQVTLYSGMITLELRQAVLLVILWEAGKVVQFGGLEADAGGRAAACAAAWIYFNQETLRSLLKSARG